MQNTRAKINKYTKNISVKYIHSWNAKITAKLIKIAIQMGKLISTGTLIIYIM